MSAAVSIVLPVHNGAAYVRESIESCLAQTYADLELIVVDDGSTDETPQVLEACARADERVRILRLEPNAGLPNALNVGFAQSTGRYLTWTSDDNRYRRHAIEAMVGVLETDATVDFVHASYTVTDESWNEIENGWVLPFPILLHWNGIGPCFLYRRAVYESTGEYSPAAALAEDYDYWLRVSARHRLFWLEEDIYEYRRHGNSLSARESRAAGDATERVLAKNLPELRWVTGKARAGAYLRLARETPVSSRRAGYLLRGVRELFRPPYRTPR